MLPNQSSTHVRLHARGQSPARSATVGSRAPAAPDAATSPSAYPPPTPDERLALHRLILRAQAGEPAAQAELVRSYTPRIGAYVRNLLGQPSAVEDVVQLVFIKTFRRLKVLRAPEAFESWLFALARNTAYDFFRRQRCRPVTVCNELEFAAAAATDTTTRPAEVMEALELALRHVSPKDRSIITMIVRGDSYRDAAKREGLSIGAVKLRLVRLRPFLRASVSAALGAPLSRQLKPVRQPRCRLAA